MKKAWIFGASKLGEVAYKLLKEKYEFIGFVDNNSEKWGGNFIDELPIENPSILKNAEFHIIIASMYCEEIKVQLEKMGIYSYEIFQYHLSNANNSNTIKKDDTGLKKVSIGALLEGSDDISVNNLTFIGGGSSVLDYFLLKVIAKKFEVKTYLEIGTWTGESVSAVAEIVEHCMSISLADETLDGIFQKYNNKSNFSRYFSYKKENVTHYITDSKIFDYSTIPVPDLVFIDGDHSFDGVYTDTKNIFNLVGYEDRIVIWHDYRTVRNEIIQSTHQAVKKALPKEYHKNIFIVNNTYCGIYIPENLQDQFEYDENENLLYSYEVGLKIKRNWK